MKEIQGNKKQLWKLFSLKSDFPRQCSPPVVGDNLDSCLSWSELKSKVWLSSLWFPFSIPSTILLRKIAVMEQFHKHYVHNYVVKITPKGTFLKNGKFFTTKFREKQNHWHIGITSCESLKMKITDNGRNVRPSVINWGFKIFMTFTAYFGSNPKLHGLYFAFHIYSNLLLFFLLHNLKRFLYVLVKLKSPCT